MLRWCLVSLHEIPNTPPTFQKGNTSLQSKKHSGTVLRRAPQSHQKAKQPRRKTPNPMYAADSTLWAAICNPFRARTLPIHGWQLVRSLSLHYFYTHKLPCCTSMFPFHLTMCLACPSLFHTCRSEISFQDQNDLQVAQCSVTALKTSDSVSQQQQELMPTAHASRAFPRGSEVGFRGWVQRFRGWVQPLGS